MKQKLKFVILGVIVLIVALVLVFQYRKAHAPLVLYGNVDIRDVNLAFRVGGRIATLKVDEGAVVKKGDILGTLDDEPFQNSLKAAKANQAAVEARNSIYHTGYRIEDVDQARSTLEQRKAAYLNAEQQYQRQKQLIKAAATTQKAVDDSKSDRDQALANYNSSISNLRLMTKGYRLEEINESDANVNAARASTAAAQLNVTDSVLKAPVDGIVITRAVEPGTMVQADATIFTLSLTRPIWVRAYTGESTLGNVIPGAHVQVTQDTNPGKIYDGMVGFVSPTAEFTPKTVETTDLRTTLVYYFRVVIQNPDDNLRQGMPVTLLFPEAKK